MNARLRRTFPARGASGGAADPGGAILADTGGYWKLNEESDGSGAVTRNDSKFTSHLTDNNTTPSNTGLLTFASDHNNANSEYFSVASNANLRHDGNAFTWQIWFYPTSAAAIRDILGKGASAGATLEYIVQMLTNRLVRFRVSSDGTNIAANLSTTATATLNAWNHLIVKHDPTNDLLIAKLNDTAAVTTALTTGVKDGAGALNIGREPNAGGLYLGRLCEALFVKRLTTDAEDTYLYNGGGGRPL